MWDNVPLFLLLSIGGLVFLGIAFLAGIAVTSRSRKTPPAGVEPPAEGDTWQRVGSFPTPEAAHIERAMLEGHGIPAQLADEHLVGTDWLYGVAVGGVGLMVPDSRRAEALDLLSQAPEGPELFPSEVESPSAEFDDEPLRTCPACGSGEVYSDNRFRRLGLVSVVLLSLPILGRKRFFCDACGENFRMTTFLDA
jgi:hypothetical protein